MSLHLDFSIIPCNPIFTAVSKGITPIIYFRAFVTNYGILDCYLDVYYGVESSIALRKPGIYIDRIK
jgi:hypothetical protein